MRIILALFVLALSACGARDPTDQACSALRDMAAAGDVAREVYMMSPEERRDVLRPISDAAAESDHEQIRSASYDIAAGMDDPRAAVVGIASLAKACQESGWTAQHEGS